MAQLEICHRDGRGNRITQANRRQIYKFLAGHDPSDGKEISVLVRGRMQDHKTREKLILLTEEFNNELSERATLWRLKRISVSYQRHGAFTCADLYDNSRKWAHRLTKSGTIELVFGLVGVNDL